MADLQLDQITKSYRTRSGTLAILNDINVSLSAGESLSIVGPSGSGKSTLLHIMGALDRPTSGSMTLFGTTPWTLPEDALAAYRNREIGFVFQDHLLLPQLNVLENCVVPALAAGNVRDQDQTRAEDLLTRIGLRERMDHLPGELSGGERQRVALVRALLMRPRLVLADEPTGNLDSVTASSVSEILIRLPLEEGGMLVIVTHNQQLAARTQFQRKLEQGRLVE